MNKHIFFGIALAASLGMIGQVHAAEKRTFQEINIEPEQAQDSDSGSMQQLDMQNMPDDDIHAQFRKGQAGAQSMGKMPEDDIHRKFKMGSMANSDALMKSVAPSAISWTAPEGWSEEKGNGMRMATLTAGADKMAVETSVISLGGNAGGTSANIGRWMGQLGIEVPSEEQLNDFIGKQQKVTTASGNAIAIIDFTQLQKDAPDDTPSMIAAIVEGESNQVFFKMTGSKQAVTQNLDAFKALIASIKNKSE